MFLNDDPFGLDGQLGHESSLGLGVVEDRGHDGFSPPRPPRFAARPAGVARRMCLMCLFFLVVGV
jgi:hypothetical protein